MFTKEDTTYNDIRRRSLEQWLQEMEQHADISVRGGVPLVRGYLEHLIQENERLQSKCDLKDSYLKKLAGKDL